MTHLMHKTSDDRSEDFDQSGAHALLKLGKLIIDSHGKEVGLYQNPQTTASTEDIANFQKVMKETQDFFHFNTITPLKSFVVVRTKNEHRHVEPKLLGIMGFMCAITMEGRQVTDVLHLTKIVASAMSVSPLEIRRVIGCLLIDGTLETIEGKDSLNPCLQMGDAFRDAFFGQFCCPDLSDATIEKIRELKKHGGLEKKATKHQSQPATPTSDCSLVQYIQRIPLLTPRQLHDELERRGYVGQDRARRQVCLAVYRFISRLRKIHLERLPASDVPLIGNLILKGETGTGKTFLLKTLSEICGLPVLIEDITKFSETGYVGGEVNTILSRSLQMSSGNLAVAQACSIIALDEIDKISETNIGNPHVSRQGVQRSLLKLIEGTVADVPIDPFDHPFRSKQVRYDTSGILWFGIGAFSGWDVIVGRSSQLGFSISDEQKQQERVSGSQDMATYGLMEELIGRFTGGIISFQPLSRREMKWILAVNTIPKFQKECALNGVNLFVAGDVYELLISDALKRKTGARSLQAALEGHLSDILYSAYSVDGVKEVRLVVDDGRIKGMLRMANKRDELAESEEVVTPETVDLA